MLSVSSAHNVLQRKMQPLVCDHHLLMGPPEWPGVTRILLAVSPQGFPTSLLGCASCCIAVPVPHLPARGVRHESNQEHTSTYTWARLAELAPVQFGLVVGDLV